MVWVTRVYSYFQIPYTPLYESQGVDYSLSPSSSPWISRNHHAGDKEHDVEDDVLVDVSHYSWKES